MPDFLARLMPGRGLVFAGLLLLGGCTPMMWFKPGSSSLQMRQDQYECAQLAEQQAFREGFYSWNSYGWNRPRYDKRGRPIDPFMWQNGPFDQMNREQSLRDFCMRARGYELIPAQ